MHTAHSIAAVASLRHPLAASIMNRESALTRKFIDQVMVQSQFSWHGRRPKPSVFAGSTRKTNLDLLSVLMELYKRQAHVELTAYDNQLPWQAYAGEQHVGGTRRYGPVVGLVSHRDQLSFSLQINDLSVIRTDGEPTAGSTRSYMIADYHGKWHAGWHGLSWQMSEQELAYFERRKLLTPDGVDFEDYIHQNRRQSVYGAPYLMLKVLWQRIEDEIAFFEAELKRLERADVECPSDLKSPERYLIASGNSTSISVPVFHVKVDGPEFSGEYVPVSTDTLGYRLAHRSLRFLKHELRPIVQFMVRADEVAFYRFALKQDFMAHWVRGTSWQMDRKTGWVGIDLADSLRLSYRQGVTEKKVAA